MFIRYMAEKAYDVAKSDSKKPRRTVVYSDVGMLYKREYLDIESDFRFSRSCRTHR